MPCPWGQQLLDRSLSVVDHFDIVPFGFEVEPQAIRQMLLVFHYEDAAHCCASGSCRVNVLPRPFPSLSAKALPPCRSATDRTMNSPNPVPLTRSATLPGIR